MPLAVRPLLRMLGALKTQRWCIQEHLEPVLAPYRAQGNVADWSKLTGYYALAVPAVIGEGFALLRGQALAEQERLALTFLGALSPVLDDLYDRQHLSTEAIAHLVQHHHADAAHSPQEALFCTLATAALQQFSPAARERFEAVKRDVLDAQAESRLQLLPETSRDALHAITLRKGGHAFELYVLPLLGVKAEDFSLAYALGAAMQVENDLFDLWKDRQEGVRTSCTESTSLGAMRDLYVRACEEASRALHAHSAGPNHKRAFVQHLNLVLARGLVCLDTLEKRTSKQVPFNAYSWPREALVVDLDSPAAKWRTLRHASNHQPLHL